MSKVATYHISSVLMNIYRHFLWRRWQEEIEDAKINN